MEHQALLPSKILLLLLLYSCANIEANYKTELYSTADITLTYKQGIMYRNDKPFTGTVFNLYNTNDTADIISYLNGKEHGSWKKYYPDNKLKEIRQFSNGQKTGKLISWWPNGAKQMEYNFENGEYQGTCTEWNNNGIMVKQMNYNAGHEDGSQKMYYDNGNIRSNYVIKNGRRYGLLGTKNCVNVSDSIKNN
jgi:antitoxin component YwqK of YwqJK toxin-antitoxin module